MRFLTKYFALAGCFLGATPQIHAQDALVPNGVVINFGGFFSPMEIDVLHDPANPNNPASYTGFLLDPNGKTPPGSPFVNTFTFNPVVDVGVRVFFVSQNDPISFQPVQSQSYPELLAGNNYIFNNAAPFFVGLYTGNQPFAPPDGIYTDPCSAGRNWKMTVDPSKSSIARWNLKAAAFTPARKRSLKLPNRRRGRSCCAEPRYFATEGHGDIGRLWRA